MEDDQTKPTESPSIERGELLYTEDGELIGTVQGSTSEGFTVETAEGVTFSDDDAGDADEEIPGQEFGEGYLMWRCTECGEMGDLDDGLPETCPNCGAPKEALTKERED